MEKRALTINDIRNYQPRTLQFQGEWAECFGQPELTGSWLIWGNSANGKTRFALQLAKYLCKFVKVAYNSLEEGMSKSMQDAIEAVGMSDVKPRFVLYDRFTVKEMTEHLRKQRAPQVVIIDSLQYTGLDYKGYQHLRDTFRNKLFIFISHADGRLPRGNVARSIQYDAFVKVYVEDFVAMPQSRYGGNHPYVIWNQN